MTDLAQAIAEVKRTTDAAHPFVVSHFSDCSILSGQEQEVATILNAAASGELIPLAEGQALRAELAATQAKLARVVEALSLAANRLLRCSVDYDAGTKKFIEVAEWAKEARAELTTLEGAKP